MAIFNSKLLNYQRVIHGLLGELRGARNWVSQSIVSSLKCLQKWDAKNHSDVGIETTNNIQQWPAALQMWDVNRSDMIWWFIKVLHFWTAKWCLVTTKADLKNHRQFVDLVLPWGTKHIIDVVVDNSVLIHFCDLKLVSTCLNLVLFVWLLIFYMFFFKP